MCQLKLGSLELDLKLVFMALRFHSRLPLAPARRIRRIRLRRLRYGGYGYAGYGYGYGGYGDGGYSGFGYAGYYGTIAPGVTEGGPGFDAQSTQDVALNGQNDPAAQSAYQTHSEIYSSQDGTQGIAGDSGQVEGRAVGNATEFSSDTNMYVHDGSNYQTVDPDHVILVGPNHSVEIHPKNGG